MSERHETLGIKQVLRLEWLQKTVNLLLAGLDSPAVRRELHAFLANKKGDGSEGERGDETRTCAVTNLMNVWVLPDAALARLRDASLAFLREHPSMSLPIHWGMISAAYPFWFNVARQTGRLLALQNQVTYRQIVNRLKERYGDRQTVSRYARYVIRSFVAWGILQDTGAKGCYEKAAPLRIADAGLAALLFESALLATPEAKAPLELLLNNPAFFPFQLPVMSGDSVARRNNRIEVTRHGLDEALLRIEI